MAHESGILMYWLYSGIMLSFYSCFGRLEGHHDSLFVCPSGQTKELRQIALSLALGSPLPLLVKNTNKGLNKNPRHGFHDGDFSHILLNY